MGQASFFVEFTTETSSSNPNIPSPVVFFASSMHNCRPEGRRPTQPELNHSRSSLFPTAVVGQLLDYTMFLSARRRQPSRGASARPTSNRSAQTEALRHPPMRRARGCYRQTSQSLHRPEGRYCLVRVAHSVPLPQLIGRRGKQSSIQQ